MATINGTAGNDVITGTTADDIIDGGDGNDRINGGTGNDTILGGLGADTLTGDAGNDTLFGGEGNDGFFGGGNNDTIYGENGNDTMYGDGANDTLFGGAGDDKLFGGTGDDRLDGGVGNDTISGDAGNDTIVVRTNSGTDTMAGGAGIDTIELQFTSSDLTAALRSDLASFKAWMDQNYASAGNDINVLAAQTTASSFTINALGVTVSAIEKITVFLDGQPVALEDILNQAPTAAATASIATDEDTPVNGQVAANDPNGDTLTWTASQGPAHGTLTLNAATGNYTYTPGANFNGSDTFKVTVTDPMGAATVQTVSVGVTPVNDAPVADATASITTQEDTPVSGQVSASDVDGDTLGYTVAQGPVNGALTLNAATGAYTYAPGANFNGADTFQVTVADPSGAFTTQTVSVGVTPVNDAPVADASVSVTTQEDTPVSGQVSASDADGDTLGYTLAQGPVNGALTLDSATGQYTYTPGANFNGADSFQVTVADPSGAFAIQTVSVGVTPVNDAPVVDASSITTTEDQVVTGQVIATDIDSSSLLYLAKNGEHGKVEINTVTGQYTYTPDANFSGADTFAVRIHDGDGAATIQNISVTIGAVADAPVVSVTDKTIALTGGVLLGTRNGETLTGSAGTTHILGGAGNDTITAVSETVTTSLDIASALKDLDGSETLSITIGGLPTGGTLSAGQANANGTWTLASTDLAGLKLTASSATDIALSVTATATEAAGGSATTVRTLNITFDRSAAQSLVEGGSGSDTLTGSAAGDVIYGASKPNGTPSLASNKSEKDDDTISGGDGNDTIFGQNGNDQIWGDNGNDTLSGGKGNDVLYGGNGDDKLNGNSGNDTLFDGAGNDTVSGDSGSDMLIAGEGDDVYNGGTGSDTLDFSGASGGMTVDVSKKTATGMGNDSFSAIEKFLGSAFNDTFKGSSAVDTINGGAGNDWLRGLGGADVLTGGAGSDTFFWEKTDVGAGLGVDHVRDFAVGDVLDFKKLVSVGSKPLADFVKVTDGAAGSTIAAKIGGVFVDVAVLDGVHGQTAATLLHDGQLLVG